MRENNISSTAAQHSTIPWIFFDGLRIMFDGLRELLALECLVS